MPITYCFKCGKKGGFRYKDGELSCQECGVVLFKTDSDDKS